jgi:hypothetical protein
MPSDDFLVLAGVLLLARAWEEWSNGPAEKIKDGGAKLYDTLHDDSAHKQDLPGKAWTKAQLVELATRAEFPDPNIAAAIAMAESGGVPNALGDGGVSIGLWQINTRAHPRFSRAHLAIPFNNALAAWEISKAGRDWSPWSVYKSGRYLRYI